MNVELFAPESYWRIPEATWHKKYEGCGPGGTGDLLVPDTMYGLRVTPACRIHDFMYEIGETEDDRREADNVLLNNCLRLINAKTKSVVLKRLRYRRAQTYYCFVRNFGGPAFWNGKNKPTEKGFV